MARSPDPTDVSSRTPGHGRRLAFLLPLLPAALAALLAAACWSEGINEVELHNGLPPGVRFRVIATPTEIAPGEEMDILVRVDNENDHGVTLIFESDCTAFFIVEDPDGGRVFPREGQECPAGGTPGPASPWDMFPNQQIDLHYTWTGVRAEPGGDVPADAGSYRLFGVLGEGLAVRTQPMEITIR